MADAGLTLDEIMLESEDRMDKALDHFKTELRMVRTGRASTALIENLRADYYGTPTPLKQLANLSTPEPALIVIKPFDASCIKDIERAIIASSVGLNPSSDGRIIRLNVPPLSGERRQQLANQIKQMAEAARVGIRNVRRDANKQIDQLQKDKSITEDQRDGAKEDMDATTKKYIEKLDEALKHKTDEIMEV